MWGQGLFVEGLEVLGVDDEGAVVFEDAALATALLTPNPTPTAAPETPRATSSLAKRFLTVVLSFCFV
jgi:hypothetical protein